MENGKWKVVKMISSKFPLSIFRFPFLKIFVTNFFLPVFFLRLQLKNTIFSKELLLCQKFLNIYFIQP